MGGPPGKMRKLARSSTNQRFNPQIWDLLTVPRFHLHTSSAKKIGGSTGEMEGLSLACGNKGDCGQ